MANENFYPSLSTLFPEKRLPKNLGLLQGLSNDIFDNFFYRNLVANVGYSGAVASFKLTIDSYNKIGFELPGTGVELIFNPSTIPNTGSEIPISLQYNWEILRLVADFEWNQFESTPNAFYLLTAKIAQVNSDDIVKETALNFIGGSNPLDNFVSNYNSNHPNNTLSVFPNPDEDIYARNITDAFDAQSIDAFQVIFDDYINDSEDFITYRHIEQIFFKFLGYFSIENIKSLLIPQVNASIDNLAVGIRFPASVLREVNPNTLEPILDNHGNDVPLTLSFTIGSIYYNTKEGLNLETISSISLPPSEILKTGFVLHVIDLKLDLSRTKNIPEAEADGRPTDFMGVYIKNGSIEFPSYWNHDENNSTGELKVYNLLVGTGGISGTIKLAAKTLGNTVPIIKVNFGGGFDISLNRFNLTFRQNAITDCSISGALTIPDCLNIGYWHVHKIF